MRFDRIEQSIRSSDERANRFQCSVSSIIYSYVLLTKCMALFARTVDKYFIDCLWSTFSLSRCFLAAVQCVWVCVCVKCFPNQLMNKQLHNVTVYPNFLPFIWEVNIGRFEIRLTWKCASNRIDRNKSIECIWSSYLYFAQLCFSTQMNTFRLLCTIHFLHSHDDC